MPYTGVFFLIHLIRLACLMASMNLAVPDSAILPRLFFSSSFVMPTPVSSMIRVLASCETQSGIEMLVKHSSDKAENV